MCNYCSVVSSSKFPLDELKCFSSVLMHVWVEKESLKWVRRQNLSNCMCSVMYVCTHTPHLCPNCFNNFTSKTCPVPGCFTNQVLHQLQMQWFNYKCSDLKREWWWCWKVWPLNEIFSPLLLLPSSLFPISWYSVETVWQINSTVLICILVQVLRWLESFRAQTKYIYHRYLTSKMFCFLFVELFPLI